MSNRGSAMEPYSILRMHASGAGLQWESSPFKGSDGPLSAPTQAFLTSTKSLPLGHNFGLRQAHHSGVAQPFEDDYGDVGAFMREASNRLGVGDQTRDHFLSQLRNPFDAFELNDVCVHVCA
jgi:hypothetical protein